MSVSDPGPEAFDVLIIGAGLSGIGAAYHLQAHCPGKSYAILESREAIGGTWDLFRYPGVRSDSDMYTLGYAFRPWKEPKCIADGASILSYIRETAQRHGIDRRIRFGVAVVSADWSSDAARWTVCAETVETRERRTFTCRFLFTCTGYYDYAQGYRPMFPGEARFDGPIVHPQHWPQDLNWTQKRVAVIGSGATAVTLVPALAETAAHVTMVQRSPTYVVARPSEDALAERLRRALPERLAYALTRWRNVLLGLFFYRLARRRPADFKRRIIAMVRAELGPDFDVETHFTPRYNPWDQRLCLAPDGDLFRALRRGSASVATGEIETFTESGLTLTSGAAIVADIIVTATGLTLKAIGGIALSVDGLPVDLAKTTSYKGMMFSGVPNLAAALGYTNASWTLKSDLTSAYVCRLLNHMDRRGFVSCTPVRDANAGDEPLLDFTSGYVLRALDRFPRQGSKQPWKLSQNYLFDLATLRFGRVEDKAMHFARAAHAEPAAAQAKDRGRSDRARSASTNL